MYLVLNVSFQYGFIPVQLFAGNVTLNITLITVFSIIGMWICKVYDNIWRYASIKDFSKCIGGIILGTVCLYALRVFAIIIEKPFVSSDIFIFTSMMLSILAVLVLRVGYFYVYNTISSSAQSQKSRTLIVGAGDACRRIISEMKIPDSKYRPIAIVDDDPVKLHRKLHNIPVVGNISSIPQIVEKYHIKTILVAMPSVTGEEKKRIMGICSETICEVKTIPHLYDLIMSADFLGQAQTINVEDLLGREVIRFDNVEVKALLRDKVCMVTGGGGSIGSELCRQIAKFRPKKLIIVDIYENNVYDIQQELLSKHPELDLDVRIASVRDYDKIKALFEMFKPEIVYHAAAHKHVPLMETSPEEAIKNNIIGTYNVASIANMYGVNKFVLVSTDKAVNPTNVMGATKRCCEMIVQYFAQKSTSTEFVAVRFGNVLGSNGSVIPLFEKQIAVGGPVTVTHPDIIRYFMTIPEAVSLILQAGTIAQGGEIFVLDMGEPVKILTLAENLIKLHGKVPYQDIPIKFSGLRPGEKLFEELLMSEEGLRETAN
ncbi:MAG: polysaccharide biosynthesis protein, partial [Clostridia bacterium]|nr:polysaccharide biosynthesis protein [Clostridia bacterium]